MKTVQQEVIIKSKQGLHARPAALFVQVANRYDSAITIKKDKEKINGKSIMGILILAAEKGTKVTIIAEGPDAEEALEKLVELVSKDE